MYNIYDKIIPLLLESPNLSQGLGIGAHIGQDDQHMVLTLVGKELGSGEGQSRGDDTLDT